MSSTTQAIIYKIKSSGGKVLIVDDEPLVARALSRRLGKAHKVDIASSATDAAKRLSSDSSYQIVISDLNMPDMDGLALFDLCKKDSPAHKDHFIFITGTPFSKLADRVRSETNAPVLAKPIDIQLLDDEIIRILATSTPQS